MTLKRKSNQITAVALLLLAALIVSFGACLAVEDDCCESDGHACSEFCHCACAFQSIGAMPLIGIQPLTECGAVGLGSPSLDHEDLDFDLDRPPRFALA